MINRRLHKLPVLLFIIFLILVAGCNDQPKGLATQAGTIDALLAGAYDGTENVKDMLEHGNFGIGTFDGLDGEMVVLDGKVYQVKASGEVMEPNENISTPFMTVVEFKTESTASLNLSLDYDALKGRIDQMAPYQNIPIAVQMRGKFTHVKTRSVPGQTKPYPPLKEVTANQPEFERENVSGTLVGFRLPPYVKGINVPGYHLHFLSNDHEFGGHVLAFTATSGNIELSEISGILLKLPVNDQAFLNANQDTDRSKELEEVEQ